MKLASIIAGIALFGATLLSEGQVVGHIGRGGVHAYGNPCDPGVDPSPYDPPCDPSGGYEIPGQPRSGYGQQIRREMFIGGYPPQPPPPGNGGYGEFKIDRFFNQNYSGFNGLNISQAADLYQYRGYRVLGVDVRLMMRSAGVIGRDVNDLVVLLDGSVYVEQVSVRLSR